jgi:hypothetical protein
VRHVVDVGHPPSVSELSRDALPQLTVILTP